VALKFETEQPTFSDGWYHENVDKRRAMTLAHQSDLVGVTTECCYVLFDPMQGRDKVEECVVSRSVAVFSTQKTFQQSIIVTRLLFS